MNFQQAEFVLSAASPADFPKTDCRKLPSRAKSNVGKILGYQPGSAAKKLRQGRDTPQKTIHVNYFCIDRKCYFVDLPGYGYAKVSQKEKERWGKLMEDYFAAQRIDLGVLIVDYRHPPTNNDVTMAQWFLDSGCPFVVVANKQDKLKKSDLVPNLETIRRDPELPETCPVIPFSAEKGAGPGDLVRHILVAVKE